MGSNDPTSREACFWWDDLAPPDTPRVLDGEESFDIAVIGGGFTGLACVRRLAELHPSARIALVEATRIGAGNSGRNSGFLLDVTFYDDAPPNVQSARTRLQKAGVTALHALVETHGIECDWQPEGYLYAACTETEEPLLHRVAARYRAHREDIAPWPGSRLRDATKGRGFRQAIHHAGSILVQPVKLVRGLASTLPSNVTVIEDTPVRRYWRTASGTYCIQTPRGRLICEQVFLCANAGVPGLGVGRGRLVPVSTFAAVTEPIEALRDAEPLGILPTVAGGPTIRILPGGRLLLRQNAAFTPDGRVEAADIEALVSDARANMARRWPDIEPPRYSHVWNGVMALTRNTASVFGRARDGAWVSAFCNGAGNTMGTSAGSLLADLSAGIESDLLADRRSLPAPTWVPPNTVLGPLVRHRIRKADRALSRIYAGSG